MADSEDEERIFKSAVMRSNILVLISLVLIASGCVNFGEPNSKEKITNTAVTLNQNLNYSEVEEVSNFISYSNLTDNPETHKGKIIREHGRVVQKLDNGFLLASRAVNTGFSYEYKSDIVWVTKSDNSKISLDQILTVFGAYKGTRKYETIRGKIKTVPQMNMGYVTDKVDVTVRVNNFGGKNVPDRVNKLCADHKCVKNVSEHTFRLAVNEQHRFWIEDKRFKKNDITSNKSKKITSKTGFSLGREMKEEYRP
jgi:hypothetical protein